VLQVIEIGVGGVDAERLNFGGPRVLESQCSRERAGCQRIPKSLRHLGLELRTTRPLC
jgi:hypothetical protein